MQAEPITNLIIYDNLEKTNKGREGETLVNSTYIPCETDVVTSEFHSKEETCIFKRPSSLSLTSEHIVYDEVDASLTIDDSE